MFMFKEMERVLGITILLSYCLFLAHSETIDITKLGAKPGSDVGPALIKAWGTACAATSATKIVIPSGSFKLEEVFLEGPCKAPIEIQVDATLTGPDDPNQITKDKEWIMIQRVENFKLSGKGTFDGKGASKAWVQSDRCASQTSCNRLANNFAFYFVNHSTIEGITSKDSKLFHMLVFGCSNLTISKITIDAPELSPNTDGIHIGRSEGVTVKDSIIKTGDDCVSLGDGCKNIKVTGITCGPGHGISVGSLGKYDNEQPVEGIYVSDCKLINTDNGVRIKTWAASKPYIATDIHYSNIEMENVSNPIIIDQVYCPNPPNCKVNPPSKVQISKVSFHNIWGTSGTPEVVKLICSKSHPCKDVEIGKIHLTYSGPLGPAISNCSNVQPKLTGQQEPKICSSQSS